MCFSCNDHKEKPLVKEAQKELNIIGSWKLMYADVLENESLQIKDMRNTEFIKNINDSHFAFFNMNEINSDAFMAG